MQKGAKRKIQTFEQGETQKIEATNIPVQGLPKHHEGKRQWCGCGQA
jgi:hypothetical protein